MTEEIIREKLEKSLFGVIIISTKQNEIIIATCLEIQDYEIKINKLDFYYDKLDDKLITQYEQTGKEIDLQFCDINSVLSAQEFELAVEFAEYCKSVRKKNIAKNNFTSKHFFNKKK
jgi:hypothetical protein